jgi:AcrR family transcriptional regulator
MITPSFETATEVGADALVFGTKQERSRRTLDRLLDAAEQLLAEQGLERATVPAIARQAGMSVGVVYRRFRDKDALLRAVHGRFFARVAEANRSALDPVRWAGVPAHTVATAVVRGIVRGHREYRGLLRALLLFAETHPDPAFRRRAAEASTEAFGQLGALLLARRGELAHADPENATGFGLLVVASTLRNWLFAETDTLGPYAADDAVLARELVRLYTQYLGIDLDAS